jgi:hypothetical protein
VSIVLIPTIQNIAQYTHRGGGVTPTILPTRGGGRGVEQKEGDRDSRHQNNRQGAKMWR